MLSVKLSNGTTLDVSLKLSERTLVVRQDGVPGAAKPAELTVPLVDIKSLVASIKTLFGFLA